MWRPKSPSGSPLLRKASVEALEQQLLDGGYLRRADNRASARAGGATVRATQIVSGPRRPRILELTAPTPGIAIQSAAEALLTVRRGGIGAVWVLYDRNCHRHFVLLKLG